MSVMDILVERSAPLRRRLPAVQRRLSAVRRVPVLGRLITWLRLDFAGSLVGTFFFCWSLTPSLLPRTWYYQALVTGVTATIGYAIGALIGVLVRLIIRKTRRGRPLARQTVTAAWTVLGIVGTASAAWYMAGSARWQSDLRDLMDVDSPRLYHYIFILLISFLLFIGFLAIGRLLRGASRRLGRFFARWVPVQLAVVLSALVVTGLAVWSWTGLFYPWFLGAANSAFAAINQETMAGESSPAIGTHSGGPGSLVTWDSLGRKGREFISQGPTAEEIEEFSGLPAMDPVRTYVGMDTAETPAGQASLAVRELERAGGFDREVLVVVTATGTGWVDEAAADALEHLYNGNSAIVSMQYSYLPSWLSFLAEGEQVDIAGEELFDAVYEYWSRLDEDSRPKLVAYGESFGAVGSAAAFDDLDELRAKVDGALWVGSPTWHPLREEFTEDRDPGSLQRLPEYQGGETVRFWGGWQDPMDVSGWEEPRVLFMQHSSDPVSFWAPDLIWSQPDWMREERGPDVLPNFNWYPFVTFWQLTADMAVSALMPVGHAHNYGGELVDAWLMVVPPDQDWSEEKLDELRDMVQSFDMEDEDRLW
ncbi:alpha/beta hydrolase [Phytoactinopolyspora endophytica]|uniref:alpha/beta hydrolase n=1 Tax=Phytoactinopolyspora endophytica TaxID=1642495 RepID=UPI00197B4167|nr:alpha/beta-hydrolase family protein [Phytoactinopolyspora endophytica]